MIPALFTSTVGGPSSACTRATASFTWSASDTSAPTAMRVAAERVDLGDGLLARVLVEVEHADRAPVRGQASCDAGADSPRCTRHDRDSHHAPFRPLIPTGRYGRAGA